MSLWGVSVVGEAVHVWGQEASGTRSCCEPHAAWWTRRELHAAGDEGSGDLLPCGAEARRAFPALRGIARDCSVSAGCCPHGVVMSDVTVFALALNTLSRRV